MFKYSLKIKVIQIKMYIRKNLNYKINIYSNILFQVHIYNYKNLLKKSIK